MQIKVSTKYLKISSKKMQPVARLIIGKEIEKATDQLKFLSKKPARFLLKSLESGLANAQNNFDLQPKDIFIKEILVGEGPSLHRWFPRAQGSAAPIKKRTSHLRIILETKPGIEIKKKTEAEKQAKISTHGGFAKGGKEPKGKMVLSPLKKEAQLKSADLKISKPALQLKETGKEIFDKKRAASGRHKQHLDKIKMKEKGGFLKRFFRRKTV